MKNKKGVFNEINKSLLFNYTLLTIFCQALL